MAHFVGVSRPGYELALDERFPKGSVSLLEIPALTISSSDCRERVARRRADLVPRAGSRRPLYRQALTSTATNALTKCATLAASGLSTFMNPLIRT